MNWCRFSSIFIGNFEYIQHNIQCIKPFHATGLFLHPLRTSENQRSPNVFMGYRGRPVA